MSAALPLPARRRPVPGRVLAALVVGLTVVTALVPAWVGARWPGSGGVRLDSLVDSVRAGFLTSLTPGSGPAVSLVQAAAFWQGFHLAKAVAGAALLGVLVMAGVRLGRRPASAIEPRRGFRVAAGLLVAAGAAVSLLVVVANVQGAVAPLASVLTFLPVGGADPDVAAAGARLAGDLRTGASDPVATALLDDFRLYHLVLVGCAALVGVGLTVGLAAVVRARRIRRRASATTRPRTGALTATAVGLAGGLAFFLLVGAANLSTALDPAPALAAFLDGAAG